MQALQSNLTTTPTITGGSTPQPTPQLIDSVGDKDASALNSILTALNGLSGLQATQMLMVDCTNVMYIM